MSTDHHTPITYNAAANAAIVNAPLAELDDAINVEHEIDGTHSANIIDQAEINLTTAAAAIRKAIRYDEFTGEHNADGTHKANIIDQAEINLTTAAAAIKKAIRYDEFTAQHLAAGGHRTDVEIITAQAQVNLAAAAAASGDAVRHNEYSVHTHPVSGTYAQFIQIFGDRSISAAADTPASTLPIYIRTDDNTNLIAFIRFALYKRDSMDYVILTGAKKNTSASLAGTITFTGGIASATHTIAAGQLRVAFSMGLDISALADDTYHEFVVQMHYAGGSGGATGQLELSNVQAWGAATAPAPT